MEKAKKTATELKSQCLCEKLLISLQYFQD